MKASLIAIASLALATDHAGAFSFTAAPVAKIAGGVSSSRLSMVLEKPKAKAKVKKISKLEILKTDSDNLLHPLLEVSKATDTQSEYFVVALFRRGRRSVFERIKRKWNPYMPPIQWIRLGLG
jgi:hypothetical protein